MSPRCSRGGGAILKWPLFCFRLSSTSREEALKLQSLSSPHGAAMLDESAVSVYAETGHLFPTTRLPQLRLKMTYEVFLALCCNVTEAKASAWHLPSTCRVSPHQERKYRTYRGHILLCLPVLCQSLNKVQSVMEQCLAMA